VLVLLVDDAAGFIVAYRRRVSFAVTAEKDTTAFQGAQLVRLESGKFTGFSDSQASLWLSAAT